MKRRSTLTVAREDLASFRSLRSFQASVSPCYRPQCHERSASHQIHTARIGLQHLPRPMMPPTRRKSAGATRAAQSTLSFNNKSARVTKPSTTDSTSNKKQTSKVPEPTQAEVIQETSIPEPISSPEVVPQQEESSPQSPSSGPRKKKRTSAAPSTSNRELQATKIKDAQIKKYWNAEEDARLAPRGRNTCPPTPFHLPLPSTLCVQLS